MGSVSVDENGFTSALHDDPIWQLVLFEILRCRPDFHMAQTVVTMSVRFSNRAKRDVTNICVQLTCSGESTVASTVPSVVLTHSQRTDSTGKLRLTDSEMINQTHSRLAVQH